MSTTTPPPAPAAPAATTAPNAAAAANPDPVSQLFSVKGIVALITGGGTGIGLILTRTLALGGASRIYILGRRLPVLQSAATSVNALVGKNVVIPLYCDITSRISISSTVSVISSDLGYINLLICNAGIGGPQVLLSSTTPNSLEEFQQQQMDTVAGWEETMRANVTGVWFTAMGFLSLLEKGNHTEWGKGGVSSQVIVVSSIAGFNKKAPGGWAYGASKAAATHVGKMLSGLVTEWGMRANVVCPGLFPSEMAAPIVEAAGGSMTGGGVIPLDKSVVPLGRMGDEKDMAGQILYLASRAGAYCNGNVVLVDGGRLGTFPSAGY
ncbi:Putative reductase [Podospora comata]|uniref:Reductase n=1 Tax=Podospora comata TaxID=48703 RepID=A0ABY6SA54_PODCO|nr:Putative reductase [Podospora comata]